jgi:uncharacterized iron-regulated membrane protein
VNRAALKEAYLSASSRRRNDAIVRKLVWLHRWLGIATCLIFALWFASGAVMLFEPFPSLARAEGKALDGSIDQALVALTPAQALTAAGGGYAVRLLQRGGRPSYIVEGAQGLVAIDAQTGRRLSLLSATEVRDSLSPEMATKIASIEGAFDYDQWVVDNAFDALRPFYRIHVADGVGTQFYVSARTGEMVQRTTSNERSWNSVGAVLHWAYFTPLRASFSAWDKTVWSVSFVAMLVANIGLVLGIVRTLAVKRARRPGLTFFRQPWMRWHHLIGLFAGVFVLTWILSGWLSMDHGRLFSMGVPTTTQVSAYEGIPRTGAVAAVDLPTLRRLPAAKEMTVTSIDGVPLLALTDFAGQSRLLTTAGVPLSPTQLNGLVTGGLGKAWGAAPTRAGTSLPRYDFYALAEGLPSTALRFGGNAARPPVYVDGGNGRILVVMDGSRTAYAWLYYGLHSFNFPVLANHPIVRDIVVLIPLTAGFVFSITGVVLGWQRMRKTVGPTKATAPISRKTV